MQNEAATQLYRRCRAMVTDMEAKEVENGDDPKDLLFFLWAMLCVELYRNGWTVDALIRAIRAREAIARKPRTRFVISNEDDDCNRSAATQP